MLDLKFCYPCRETRQVCLGNRDHIRLSAGDLSSPFATRCPTLDQEFRLSVAGSEGAIASGVSSPHATLPNLGTFVKRDRDRVRAKRDRTKPKIGYQAS